MYPLKVREPKRFPDAISAFELIFRYEIMLSGLMFA